MPDRKDAAHDQRADMAGMGLGVRQRQGRTPRSAEYQGLLGFQHFCAQTLYIGNQIPGCIVVQAGMRRRPAAAALVEQQYVVAFRIEQLPMGGGTAAAGAAMQKNGGLARRVAAKLPIHTMAVVGLQKTVGIRLNFWIHLNVPCAGRPIDASGAAMSWLLRLLSSENQIPDAMPQAQATGFKFGLRTKVGAWGIAVRRRIGKAGFGAKHFQHLLGIVFPVGSAVYVAARRNAAGQ